MRVLGLTMLLIGGIIIGSLRGQQPPNPDASYLEQEAQKREEIKLPEVEHELCHKDFIRFYRIQIDGHKGMWHMYNEEDKKFLGDIQRRINSGQYEGGKIEWFAIEGRLPK